MLAAVGLTDSLDFSMLNRHAALQQQHERAFVAAFLAWFNRRHRSAFVVLSKPNPPEAIVRSGSTTRWIEVGAVFWTGEYARDLRSYATPDEAHQPMETGLFQNMDERFSERFVDVLKNKLQKKSYVASLQMHDPGYLIMPVYHPWFDSHTIENMKRAWKRADCNDLGCFRSVFIAYRSLNAISFSRFVHGAQNLTRRSSRRREAARLN